MFFSHNVYRSTGLVLILLGFSFVSSGCFGDSPSKKEIEKAVIDLNPNCEYIFIKDIEKVNGKNIGGGAYSIDVKYKIIEEATSESKQKFKEHEKLMMIASSYNTMEEASLLSAKQAELGKEEKQKCSEHMLKTGKGPVSCFDIFDEYQRKQEAIYNSYLEERNKYGKMNDDAIAIAQSIVQDYSKKCNVLKNVQVYSSAFKGNHGYSEHAQKIVDGFSLDVSQTITLQKTDNGWMLSK